MVLASADVDRDLPMMQEGRTRVVQCHERFSKRREALRLVLEGTECTLPREHVVAGYQASAIRE